MKLKLDQAIVSSEDLKGVIEELKTYRADFRHRQILKRAGAHHSEKEFDLSLSAIGLTAQAGGGKPLTLSGLEQLIDELENMYSSWPKVRIILAANPTPGIKKKITAWVRDNVKQSVLIDFRYDSTIIGGMIVVVGSHIYDWSLRRELLASKDKLNLALSDVR